MSDSIQLHEAKDKSTVEMRVKAIKLASLYYSSFSKRHLVMVTRPEMQSGDLMVVKCPSGELLDF